MDLDAALEVVWSEVARRGQNSVARALGVSKGTPTKWRKGARPEGDTKARVIQFAEQVRGDTAGVSSRVVREAGPDPYALGIIRGQAEAVRRFLLSALDEQERVLAGLDRLGATPPVSRAVLDETARRQLEADAAATRRRRGTG